MRLDGQAAGATGNGRWWAIAALALAAFAVGLDLTVVSVALPTLARAFGAPGADLQWFSASYALALAAAFLPAGRLADRYGCKKVVLASLAGLAAGSLACAFSGSAAQFIAARALLGLAGAGVTATAVPALSVLSTEERRPRAVALWTGANVLSLPLGPLLGGWLLSRYWWGWVFLVNVPVAALGLVAVTTATPAVASPVAKPTTSPPLAMDAPGVLSSSAGLFALTYGFIAAGEHGWASPGALGPVLLGLALLMGFGSWEQHLGTRRGRLTLVGAPLARLAALGWGGLALSLAALVLAGLAFSLPQYSQVVAGTGVLGSGLRLLAVMGGLVAGLLVGPGAARRAGPKLGGAGGFALVVVGLATGAATVPTSSGAPSAAWAAAVGAGTGLAMATVASAALSDVPSELARAAPAVLQALRDAGAALGSAVIGSALASAYTSRLGLSGLPLAIARTARRSVFAGLAAAHASGSSPLLAALRAAFAHGLSTALAVGAGLALVGLLATLRLPSARQRLQAPATGTAHPRARGSPALRLRPPPSSGGRAAPPPRPWWQPAWWPRTAPRARHRPPPRRTTKL